MSTATRPSPLAVAAAFAAIYLLWGSNFLAIRIAVETIPPFLLMGARSLVAGVLLFGWALVRKEGRLRRQHWYGAAAVGTLLFLVGHGGLAWAQQHVPSGMAALLMATIPIWMVLLEWRLLHGPRPGAATWTGLALGFAGIVLLVRSGGGASVAPPGPALVLMASAFGWAAGSVGSRLVPTPASVAAATGQQLIVGGILLLAVAAASGELSPPPVVSIRSLLAMAYMVVAASLVSFTAYVWLLRVSTPGRVSSYAFVNPVVAVVVGWALGGEAVTGRTIVAAAVIVVGVMLIVTSRARTASVTIAR